MLEPFDSLNGKDCCLLLKSLGISTEIKISHFTKDNSIRELIEFLTMNWLTFQTVYENKNIIVPLAYPLFSLKLFPQKSSGKALTIMHPYIISDLPESSIEYNTLRLYYEFNARNITGIVIKDWFSLIKYQNRTDQDFKPSQRLTSLFKKPAKELKIVKNNRENDEKFQSEDYKPFLFQYFE